jgi:MFS family permease
MADAAATRARRVGVVALCLVQFVDVLGVTVVATALPTMLSDLHAAPESGALIVTGYAMLFGGLLMVGARLGDRFGHRRVILAGLVLFALAAVTGASAVSIDVLTVARCLQGAAAAVSVPSALRLLTTTTAEGSQRRRALALWSAAGAAAGASGFVIGGVATQLAGWRVVFWGYLPLAVVLALAIAATVPGGRDDAPAPGLNLAAAATFTTAVMLFVVATTLLEPGRALLGSTLLLGALAAAGLFVIVDRRASAPLLPRPLLRNPSLRAGTVAALLNTATTSSAITLLTLYLQNTRAYTPLMAGLTLLPFSAAVVAGSALAGRALSRQSPPRVIAAGLTAIAVSDATLIPTASVPWAVPIAVAVGGLGIGLSSVAATGLSTTVPVAERGSASGVVNTAAQLGTALGIAILMLVTALTTGIPAGPDTPTPIIGWATAATVSILGAAVYASRVSTPATTTV